MLRRTNEWGWILSSWTDGTRPVSTMMTSVTPAVASFGSYAQLISGAALTDDVYEITLYFAHGGIAATARSILARLGFDAAGGTLYTAVADLLIGQPLPNFNAGTYGSTFVFPLFIKAGTSIGIAGSASANTTAFRAGCMVRGRPSRPDAIWAGSSIEALGVDTANSAGASITPGTATEGAWASIGTLTRACAYIEYGYSIANAATNDGALHIDLGIGDASNKKIFVSNHSLQKSSAEWTIKHRTGEWVNGAVGDIVYGRAQDSATVETGHTIAAYAVS